MLLPLPPGAQLQVELTETGIPSAVWVVTANGRFTIAAYAAPKTGGLWREVAGELAKSLRKDGAEVSVQDGRWGREVVGTAAGVVRFIGVDGYRWMIRCVVNASAETVHALTEKEVFNALLDAVIRRGDTPLPVRTPLRCSCPSRWRRSCVRRRPPRARRADSRSSRRSLTSRTKKARPHRPSAAVPQGRRCSSCAVPAASSGLVKRRQTGGTERGRVRADLIQGYRA